MDMNAEQVKALENSKRISEYGYCPDCGELGTARERRLDGYTFCASNHKWKQRNPDKEQTENTRLKQALIKIEETCMLYGITNDALQEISDICTKVLDNKR